MGTVLYVVSLLLGICVITSPMVNLDYSASCSFSTDIVNIPITVECLVSNDSTKRNHKLDLQIAQNLVNKDVLDDYCTPRSDLTSGVSRGMLAIARRGFCSFAEKAIVAQSLGYKAIVVVNDDDELFVIGTSGEAHVRIPVFLVGKTLLQNLRDLLVNPKVAVGSEMINAHLQFDKAKQEKYAFQDSSVPSKMGIALSLCLLVSPIIRCFTGGLGRDRKGKNFHTMQCVVILLLGFTLRLGTLRIFSPFSADHSRFNHNETDERIYQFLVDSISVNWKKYRLDNGFIHRYQLSKENYGDDLFIHPPLFVYLSACLHHFDVSLAIIPSIFHLLTALCIISILEGMDVPPHVDKNSVIIKAVQFFVFCPIGFFCSQKVSKHTNIVAARILRINLAVRLYFVRAPYFRVIQ